MKKGVSVNLPNQPEMNGGRVVEHHQVVGADVMLGAIVLTVQIHDRTLQFKSPVAGALDSIAPLGTLPDPGDLLFRLLADNSPEPKSSPESKKSPDQKDEKADLHTTEPASDRPTATTPVFDHGVPQASVNDSLWAKFISPVRAILGALMWLLIGSVFAGGYSLLTDGDSPIGGWLPENRITVFDGVIDKVSELHIDWIKAKQLDRYEEDERLTELRKERKAGAEANGGNNDQGDVDPAGTEALNRTNAKPQISADQGYQENVRPCSVKDKSCDPEVHVLCQLRVGSYSGEERWRNPIQSYMCAPQAVSYSNGMWRQGYADGTEACRKYFGENAFLKASLSRNSGFISSPQHQSDKPAQACLEACGTEAAKFNKHCTGLPQTAG